ncbi:MAG: tRNA uracil 4-sulfurtransferase ThiI [Candidatus Palauibacterales bacterium]|nr:tRNA uracil 4-sulfurtransferase ThiI [Candidatus Palauibacterales bacterium]
MTAPDPQENGEASGRATASGGGAQCTPGVGCVAMLRLAGEVTTKSNRTRRRFHRRLVENLRDALSDVEGEVEIERRWSRLFVRGPDRSILEPLGRVFGLSTYSEIEGLCPPQLDAIVECGEQLFGERVKGRRFAVKARRSGEHDFDSYDVQRDLGAALNPGAEVDLDHPEVTVHVEVREDRAYLYSEKVESGRGLPLGVQGRALALISGGFDSVVAAWMTMRRGVDVDYLFCNLGGGAYRRMVLEVAKELADRWSYGTRPDLHVVDFADVQDELRRSVDESYWQVILKRLMYRAGSAVADEVGAEALVTGESIGQVSSQTLRNLRAIDGVADLPVLRPLVGFDKEEIIDRARRIGTFELSARVREYCAMVPGRPVTAASPERALEAEADLDLEVLSGAVAERATFDLRGLTESEIASGHLFIDRIPEGASVLDTRPEGEYDEWHWPGSDRRDFRRLREEFDELDPERTYVLVCAEGLKTAHLAEEMQEAGYEAYSLQGGVRGLKELEPMMDDEAGAGRPRSANGGDGDD